MKVELRKKVHEQLKELKSEEFFNKSINLSQNLFSLLGELSLPNKMIGVFAPIQKEPLWFLSFGSEYDFALPSLRGEKMNFSRASFNDLKEKTSWFVSDQESVFPKTFIVPGVAFSEKMHRLGRGKGFFDKYLEGMDCIKIGVCFHEQLFKEIPCDEFDINMDYIVTEKTVLKGKI